MEKARRRGGGGGGTHLMHGRGRMAVDPRIPRCRGGTLVSRHRVH